MVPSANPHYYPHTHQPTQPPTHPSIHPPNVPPAYPSTYPSVHPSICPATLTAHQLTHPPAPQPSTHPAAYSEFTQLPPLVLLPASHRGSAYADCPWSRQTQKQVLLRRGRGAGVACGWSSAHRPVHSAVPHLLLEASRRDPPSPLCRSPLPGLCVLQRPHPEPCPNTPPSQRSRPGSGARPPRAPLSANTAPACLSAPCPETGAPLEGQAASGPALMLLRRVCGGREGRGGGMEVQVAGAREEAGMARLFLCDPPPHQSLQAACRSGPRGLPSHPSGDPRWGPGRCLEDCSPRPWGRGPSPWPNATPAVPTLEVPGHHGTWEVPGGTGPSLGPWRPGEVGLPS